MTVPYSGIQIPQPGQSLQRQRRVWRIFTDQHGRRLGAQADALTNAPIGEFQPQAEKGWVIAPWYPTMFYAKFAQTGDLEFRWDYHALAEEWSGQTAAYYEEAVKLALQIPGECPIPDVGGPIDRRIRAVLGAPPRSPAIPLACELGDPWLLGRIGAPVNMELKALIEQQVGANGQEALKVIRERLEAQATASAVELVESTPAKAIEVEKARTINDPAPIDPASIKYADFMSEARARGMTYAEASLAWSEHKKNLAAEMEVAA